MLTFFLTLPIYFLLARKVFSSNEEMESHHFVYSVITFLTGLNNLVGIWYIEQTLAFLLIDLTNVLDSDALADKYRKDYYVSIKFFRISAVLLTPYCETYYMIWICSIFDFLHFLPSFPSVARMNNFPFKFAVINLNLVLDFLLFWNTLHFLFSGFSFIGLLYSVNCFVLVYTLLCQHLMDLEALYGVEFPTWMERYNFIKNKLDELSYHVF